MHHASLVRTLGLVFVLCCAALQVVSQPDRPHLLVLPLQCRQTDCLLLKGAPVTVGVRSGFVRLAPGQTVGWHTTGSNEETLVILRGRGRALIEGADAQPFAASMIVYIPPATRHNVLNTGNEPLEYVYVVAPAQR